MTLVLEKKKKKKKSTSEKFPPARLSQMTLLFGRKEHNTIAPGFNNFLFIHQNDLTIQKLLKHILFTPIPK